MNDCDTYILRENLKSALSHAIKLREEIEAQHGPEFESALRAGWKKVLADLQAGKRLTVRD